MWQDINLDTYLLFQELVQWLKLPDNYGPSNKYQQWTLRNYIIIIMISKQLRAAKQLIPLNEYFKPKQMAYRFAVSKEALKAIYATSYQRIISLANQRVTSQYQVQYHLNEKVLLSITDKDQLEARQKLSQLLSCVLSFEPRKLEFSSILKETEKQCFELQMLLKQILEFNVRSPLAQSQIQEILDSVFDDKNQKLKQNMKQLLNFDVKSALHKAAISDIQQQKLVYPKQQLVNLLSEVSQFYKKSILKKSQKEIIIVNILKGFQEKRALVSELLKFDVQSLALPKELLKGTDPQIFAEAKKEMQAYFREGIILDSEIFTQERFADGRNNLKTIKNQQATGEKLFIFHPTFIVTGQMFCILDQYFDRTLIYGKRGESKSVSIVLKVLLQNEATKYVIKNQGSAEMKALQKFINLKRKMFYWNIDPIQKFDRNTLIEYYLKIVETVRKQCFEQLDQQTKNQIIDKCSKFQDYCNKISQEQTKKQQKIDIKTKEQIEAKIGHCHDLFGVIIRILKKFYKQKGLKLAVTIDQINSLFSHIRKANMIYLQQPKRFEQNKEWLNQSAIANFLRNILQTMIGFSSYDVFYNSSINIERDYIKSPSGDRNYLSAKLYNRELLKQAKIFYEEDELKYVRNAEMEGYFKFEIQRTFGAEKAKKMGWASKAIKDYLKEKSARNILMTPLQIRYFMENYQNKNKNNNAPDPKLFKMLLAQWDKNTSKVLRYINFLKKLPKRQRQVNIKLLLSLANSYYKQANEKAIIEVEKIRLNSNKTPIQEFETRAKKNQLVSNNQAHINNNNNVETRTEKKQTTSENKIDIKEIEGALDKQNFEIVERDNKKCLKAIQFCHQDIIAILQQIDQIDKQVPIQEYCKQEVNRALQFERNKGTIGNFVESYLLMNLVQGRKILQFGDMEFSIERKYPFQMITKLNQNLFMKNIFQNLQKQKEIDFKEQKEKHPAQQMKTTLFIPFPKNDEPMIKTKLYQISPRTVSMRSPNSKGIDFLIVQKSEKVLDQSDQPGRDPKQEVFVKTSINMSFFQITIQEGNIKDKLLEALESVYELVSKGQLSNESFQVANINLFLLLENSNVHRLKKIEINENYITELFDKQLKKKKVDQERRLKLEEEKSFLLPKVEKGFLNVKFVQIQDCIITPFSLFNCLFSSFMKQFEEIAKKDKERRREQRSRSRTSKQAKE